MHVGFRITLEDGSTVESHDSMWNQIRDHTHALKEFSEKKWVEYELTTDANISVKINFLSGEIEYNGNKIHMADPVTEEILTGKSDPQEFPVREEWKVLNGLPYFPIAGRRVWKGWDVDKKLHFAGWKRKMPDGRTVQRIVFIDPQEEKVIFT